MLSTEEDRTRLIGIEAPDDEALAAFSRRTWPRLISFARHKGLTREEAEDVAQDTLTTACIQLREQKFQGTGSLAAWLYGILRHRISDVLRNRVRDRGTLVSMEDVSDAMAVDPEARTRVHDALLAMPLRDRLVLLVNVQGGKPAREIAPLLNVGVKTTEAILTKARKRFAELIAGGQENPRLKRL